MKMVQGQVTPETKADGIKHGVGPMNDPEKRRRISNEPWEKQMVMCGSHFG